jgi:hypothetical protein
MQLKGLVGIQQHHNIVGLVQCRSVQYRQYMTSPNGLLSAVIETVLLVDDQHLVTVQESRLSFFAQKLKTAPRFSNL